MVDVPAHPVVYVIHSVGIRHGSHVGQGWVPVAATYAVGVRGQQSVAHGTVVLDTLMYMGHIRSVAGGGHDRVGQLAVFFGR